MTVRNLTHNEAYRLFNKLTENGYLAQLYYADSKWKVQVEEQKVVEKDNGKNLFG